MILVDASGITLSHHGGDVLRDVSLTVQTGDRLGVVGHNGAGKSTLLGIVSGEIEPDAGVVRRQGAVRMSTLAQQPTFEASRALEAVGDSWEAAAVLDRLGLGHRLDSDVMTMSGGEQRRVALARALVAPADLLVLDEPTNHLDIDAIAWLEERLRSFSGGLLIVSHDRHLLDAVTTKVIEVDQSSLFTHDGGYRAYLEGRAARLDADEQAETVRRNLARREAEWLKRGAPARTSKPKAHIARAEAAQISGRTTHVRDSDLNLHSTTPRLGNTVIELEAITAQVADRVLVEGFDLLLDPRERLGIIGPNGTGKSTLLDIIAKRNAPESGSVVHGSTVRLGYFDQLGRDLDPKQRVIDAFTGGQREADWRDKALLERFWFDAATQYSPISDLSGGERRRLQLVLVLAQDPNVLLLDEPTNDLDLDTLRSLEDFLDEWPGALVTVSHDRAFLERVVADVIVVDESTTAGRVAGGFAAWVEERRSKRRRGHASAKPAPTTPAAAPKAQSARAETGAEAGPDGKGPSKSTLRHSLKRVDSAIRRATANVDDLTTQLGATQDHAEIAALGAQVTQAQVALDQLEDEWMTISLALEES